MKTLMLILLGIWMVSGVAYADVVISGTQVTATVNEPTENSNGSPLTDLMETQVTFEDIGDIVGEQVCGGPITASSPTGGGVASTTCTLPVTPDSEIDFMFRNRTKDLSGNESDPPGELLKRVDLLAPKSGTF